MKTIIISLGLLLPLAISAQNFPTNAQVVKAVMAYNENIETAQVTGSWRLEREEGYNFSNMAKVVVSATTHKQNGISKKLTGLAIYVRGSGSDAWNFSRYFVTSTEFVGLASLSSEQLVTQTYQELAATPIHILPNLNYVAWVYEVSIAEGVQPTQDLTGDFLYSPAFIEYEDKFIAYEFPFEGGIRRVRLEVTLYVRPVDGALRVVRAVSNGQETKIKETYMTQSAWEALPTLAQKPYVEISGPNGPETGPDPNAKLATPTRQGAAPAAPANNPQQPAQQPEQSNDNKITIPKVRLNIRKNG